MNKKVSTADLRKLMKQDASEIGNKASNPVA